MFAGSRVSPALTLTPGWGRGQRNTMALLLRWLFVCLVFDEVVKAHNPHDNVEAMAVSLDGQHVWVSSRHKVYRSEDFGLTWVSAHGTGLPLQGGAARLALSPGYARDDWSAYLGNGRKLYHTRDQLPAVAVELVRRSSEVQRVQKGRQAKL